MRIGASGLDRGFVAIGFNRRIVAMITHAKTDARPRGLKIWRCLFLAELGFSEVKLRTGDGYQGWAEHALYDRTMVTAGPPEMPEALLEQLAAGGRLVVPAGWGPSNQRLVVVTKDASGRIRRRPQLPVRFVPMVRGESTVQ